MEDSPKYFIIGSNLIALITFLSSSGKNNDPLDLF